LSLFNEVVQHIQKRFALIPAALAALLNTVRTLREVMEELIRVQNVIKCP
jgi:hypothetical protein